MELELYIRLWPDFFILAQGERVVSEVERLLRSVGGEPEPNTVLATVLFTDTVGSTAKAAELGDPRWAQLVERRHALVRRGEPVMARRVSTPVLSPCPIRDRPFATKRVALCQERRQRLGHVTGGHITLARGACQAGPFPRRAE